MKLRRYDKTLLYMFALGVIAVIARIIVVNMVGGDVLDLIRRIFELILVGNILIFMLVTAHPVILLFELLSYLVDIMLVIELYPTYTDSLLIKIIVLCGCTVLLGTHIHYIIKNHPWFK